jgi:hypothetical protein
VQKFVIKLDDNLFSPDMKFTKVSIDSVLFQVSEIEDLNDRRKLLSRQRMLSLCKRGDY